jgi:hypothetical protein
MSQLTNDAAGWSIFAAIYRVNTDYLACRQPDGHLSPLKHFFDDQHPTKE